MGWQGDEVDHEAAMEDDGAKLRSEVAVGKRQKARFGVVVASLARFAGDLGLTRRAAQGRGFADGAGDDREFGAAFESLEAADAAGPARCAHP